MAVNPYLMAALEDPDLRDFAYLFQNQDPATQPPMEMAPNPGMMDQWQPAPQEESPGFLGHVSHALSYLNRPNSALWSAVKAAQQGKDIGGGAWRGLMGEEETGLSDILGIEGGKPTDDWLPWLGKSGLKLGADIAGDPLNALFLPIKGASLASRGAKALGSDALRRKFYETGVAQKFVRDMPSDLFPVFSGAKAKGQRIAGLAREDAADMFKAAEEALAREHPEIDRYALNEMVARNPELLGPEYRAAIEKLKGASEAGRESLNAMLTEFGLEPLGRIAEGPGTGITNWVPRFMTEGAGRKLDRLGSKRAPMGMEDFGHREFVKLVNPEGISEPLEQAVTKFEFLKENPDYNKYFNDLLSGFQSKGLAGGGPYELVSGATPGKYQFKGKPVDIVQATTKDIEEAARAGQLGEFAPGSQVADPATSYMADRVRKGKAEGYLTFLKELEKGGEGKWIKSLDEMPSGWRQPNVPRLQGDKIFVTPKAIAGQVENLASRSFDPSTPLGGIGSAMQHFFERTAPGQAAVRFKNLFNAATLPLHPGFQFGNAISDPFLLYESGLNPLSILLNKGKAVNVARGVGESLPGMTNQELRRQLAARDITRGSWSGSLGGDILSEAQRSPWYQGTPGLEQIGNAAHKLTQGGYGVGQAIEGNSRIAAVLDFMKKNYPDFATMAPEAQATALDRAAQWATNALVNYNLTPFESQASNIAPYIGWILGQPARTAQILATHPERLNRVGMALDTAFQPLSNEEKQTADPWIRESMPVKGMFGKELPEKEGLPGMSMLSRFVPQGDLDRMLPGIGRPGDYAVASLLPPWKVPWEVMFNQNAQKGMPLDRVAGGFPGNILNYFLDKPYSPASEKTLGWRGPEALRVIGSEMPGGRYLNELNTLGRTAGLWQDETKPEMSPLDFLTWYATGGKTFPFDQGKYLKHRQQENAEQKSALKSQLKYFGGKGDEETAARLAEILAAMSTRNPQEGAW